MPEPGELVPFPNEEPPYEGPRPGKSTILFELIEGDTCQWTRWNAETKRHETIGLEIEELQYEGGSAEIEAEQGMLAEAVYSLLDDEEHASPGWWVVEGFYGSFWKDYYGEVDCDYSCDIIRRARWADIEHFGVARPPLWVRVVRLLGFDPLVRGLAPGVQPVAPGSS